MRTTTELINVLVTSGPILTQINIKKRHDKIRYWKSKNNPGRFCYISGNRVLPNSQTKITDFVKKAYHEYFGVKRRYQEKPFAPCICY